MHSHERRSPARLSPRRRGGGPAPNRARGAAWSTPRFGDRRATSIDVAAPIAVVIAEGR